jgi:hypothetical protein
MNMKRLFLLLGAAALLVTSSFAEGFTGDGNWWRSQQRVVKAGYVTGVTDGVYIGAAMLSKVILEKLKITPNADVMDLLHKSPRGLFGDVKVGPIIDAIDRFYSDVRNRRIPTYYVVKMQIASTPDEQIRLMWTQDKNR